MKKFLRPPPPPKKKKKNQLGFLFICLATPLVLEVRGRCKKVVQNAFTLSK